MREKTYDVFLSHNSSCKPVVEAIAEMLEEHGIRVFLDKWHLVPGEPWQEALEHALDESSCCAVFVGPDGIGSWENEEMRVALEMRTRHDGYRVIPVLLPGADPRQILIPPFLRRMTWVDLREGVDSSHSVLPLIAGVRGTQPGRPLPKGTTPLEKGILHPLPPAPFFTGRTRELDELQQRWRSRSPCLISLIGIGGAGKTAIAAEFLSLLLGGQPPTDIDALSHPDSIFVWSFYVDQNVDSFLCELHRHLAGGQVPNVRGTSAVYRLSDLLAEAGHSLIVMDGLERVQRPCSDNRRMFGDIEDPLLRHLVRRLGAGIGNCMCLITSRFPLSDIEMWTGRSYHSIDVDRLDRADAIALLRNHGVEGTESEIAAVVDEYGAHALTIDHLGTYLAEFCGARLDASRALPEPELDSATKQERRLARILRAYETVLSRQETDLLQRLCLFRFGTSPGTLAAIFGAKDRDTSGSLAGMDSRLMRRLLGRLVSLHLVLRESKDVFTTHPAVKDHFYRRFRRLDRFHGEVVDHFSSLASRPGVEKPRDPQMLDLLEEIVYHSIASGRLAEAKEIYRDKLGGSLHLGFILGEYARGLRILDSFPSCPAPEDRLHFLQAVGNLAEAAALCSEVSPDYRYAPLLLAGRLPEVLDLSTEEMQLSTLHQVKLLMCKTIKPPDPCLFTNKLTCVVHPFLAHYYGHAMRQILVNMRNFLSWDGSSKHCAYSVHWGMRENAEQATRASLALAEVDRQAGDLRGAEMAIAKAGDWVTRSGSQELLCLLYLTRGRVLRARNATPQAETVLKEAVHLARTCKLALHHIELMIELAELALDRSDVPSAAHSVQTALNGILSNTDRPAESATLPLDQYAMVGARHPTCQYELGSLRARRLLAPHGPTDRS